MGFQPLYAVSSRLSTVSREKRELEYSFIPQRFLEQLPCAGHILLVLVMLLRTNVLDGPLLLTCSRMPMSTGWVRALLRAAQ